MKNKLQEEYKHVGTGIIKNGQIIIFAKIDLVHSMNSRILIYLSLFDVSLLRDDCNLTEVHVFILWRKKNGQESL